MASGLLVLDTTHRLLPAKFLSPAGPDLSPVANRLLKSALGCPRGISNLRLPDPNCSSPKTRFNYHHLQFKEKQLTFPLCISPRQGVILTAFLSLMCPPANLLINSTGCPFKGIPKSTTYYLPADALVPRTSTSCLGYLIHFSCLCLCPSQSLHNPVTKVFL